MSCFFRTLFIHLDWVLHQQWSAAGAVWQRHTHVPGHAAGHHHGRGLFSLDGLAARGPAVPDVPPPVPQGAQTQPPHTPDQGTTPASSSTRSRQHIAMSSFHIAKPLFSKSLVSKWLFR